MSNERIDLTQFEGLTTPWDFHAKYLHIESAKVAVKLIAELKRCYEEIDELKELCHEFLGQALTLYDVGNQHKDVDYDYREFNKLRTRFAELLDFKSASE